MRTFTDEISFDNYVLARTENNLQRILQKFFKQVSLRDKNRKKKT